MDTYAYKSRPYVQYVRELIFFVRRKSFCWSVYPRNHAQSVRTYTFLRAFILVCMHTYVYQPMFNANIWCRSNLHPMNVAMHMMRNRIHTWCIIRIYCLEPWNPQVRRCLVSMLCMNTLYIRMHILTCVDVCMLAFTHTCIYMCAQCNTYQRYVNDYDGFRPHWSYMYRTFICVNIYTYISML